MSTLQQWWARRSENSRTHVVIVAICHLHFDFVQFFLSFRRFLTLFLANTICDMPKVGLKQIAEVAHYFPNSRSTIFSSLFLLFCIAGEYLIVPIDCTNCTHTHAQTKIVDMNCIRKQLYNSHVLNLFVSSMTLCCCVRGGWSVSTFFLLRQNFCPRVYFWLGHARHRNGAINFKKTFHIEMQNEKQSLRR